MTREGSIFGDGHNQTICIIAPEFAAQKALQPGQHSYITQQEGIAFRSRCALIVVPINTLFGWASAVHQFIF
jgi:hypothetical protein